VLVYTNGTILVDSILGGTGLPTPSLEGIGIVRMNLYHMGTVEQDTNRSTRQDFSVGIVSDLSAILIPLATNQRDRFRVSHILFLWGDVLISTLYRLKLQESTTK
jgi:hypothetical protein